MARLLGRDGKTFRDVSRRVFGFYPTHGDILDARVRAFLYAYHVTLAGNADGRVILARAFKTGATLDDAVKQITTASNANASK